MSNAGTVEEQLKKLEFNVHGWGRSEVNELANIILPGEEIYEVVNGTYEGGFALLATTNIRLLLIDKKPLRYLTVEDLRFDMINEIDYSHRMFGAQISISTGSKTMKFRSYNQQRLRKAIHHVQVLMAQSKQKVDERQQDQSQHLQLMNQQLQAYLLAQHKHQEELHQQLREVKATGNVDILPEPAKVAPPAQLADYLYAKSLLIENGHAEEAASLGAATQEKLDYIESQTIPIPNVLAEAPSTNLDLAEEGRREVFGKHLGAEVQSEAAQNIEVNPLKVAYSKLPLALRNRKFGRPSFHAHSASVPKAHAFHNPA